MTAEKEIGNSTENVAQTPGRSSKYGKKRNSMGKMREAKSKDEETIKSTTPVQNTESPVKAKKMRKSFGKEKTQVESKQGKKINKKRKLKKKSKSKAVVVDQVKLGSAYLQLWENDRTQWRFMKVRQVWLLQHMYSSENVTVEDFDIMLKYMEGLQGSARELTKTNNQSLMTTIEAKVKNKSENEEIGDKEMKTLKDLKTKLKRAKQISKLLT